MTEKLEKEAQVLNGIGDWRSAHSWLRGYSDAQRGIVSPAGTYDEAAYMRGAETARAQ